jgi:4-hydroxy-4-methyl-2-oxoglutarate aldolase
VAGMMKNAGFAALVTDGLARDRAGIVAAGLPLFCAGIVPNSPAKNGPGSVGLPITIGGVPVSPGDVVVGDADGVVVVPQAILDATVKRLKEVQTAEVKAEAAVKAGAKMTPGAAALLKSPRVLRL